MMKMSIHRKAISQKKNTFAEGLDCRRAVVETMARLAALWSRAKFFL
jgi:hypothetical protein